MTPQKPKDRLVSLVREIAEAIAEHTVEIIVSPDTMQALVSIELVVDQQDYPKIIGKGGRNIRAMRVLCDQIGLILHLPSVQLEVRRPPGADGAGGKDTPNGNAR